MTKWFGTAILFGLLMVFAGCSECSRSPGADKSSVRTVVPQSPQKGEKGPAVDSDIPGESRKSGKTPDVTGSDGEGDPFPSSAPIVYHGKVGETHGSDVLIHSLLVPVPALEKALGPDWRLLSLMRRVRVQGTAKQVDCNEPWCPSTKTILRIEDVKRVDICKGPYLFADRETVECPVSDVELDACLLECSRRSNDCDGTGKDRGRLRRCGCAYVSCKHGCRDHGIADFRCR